MVYQYSDNILLKSFFVFLILLYSLQTKSQRSDDIGFFIGGSYYMGDINPNTVFYKPSPALGITYRHNYNPFFSISYEIKRGGLNANDSDFTKTSYQLLRKAEMSKNHLTEGAILMEYNLFPVSGEKSKREVFSPYIKLGVAVYYASKASKPNQLCIPFGVGIKYKWSKKVETSIEWAYRKTFNDNIDDISQYFPNKQFKQRQRSFSKTKDWYSFFGINLHYSLKRTSTKCPAYSNFQ